MDIGERVFGRFSNWLRGRKSNALASVTVALEDELVAVHLFSQATHKGALILGGGTMATVSPEVIRLPSHTNQFPRYELNRFLLLHKALVSGAIIDLNLGYPEQTETPWKRSLAIYLNQNLIQRKITESFPTYPGWAETRLVDFRNNILAGKLEREDRAWLRLVEKLDCATDSTESYFSAKSIVEKQSSGLVNAITRMPAYALAPWCELLKALPSAGSANARRRGQRNAEPKTSLNNPGTSNAEYVEIDQKIRQDSPISHSFEKLETADEYTGGYRSMDGSDQLADHQQALEELRLDKVTRDGEAAASQYSADLSGNFQSDEAAEEDSREPSHIWLPEWDYKKHTLKDHYCRLYNETAKGEGCGETWVAGLKEKYRQEVSEWESKLWSLLNKRRWKDRELDGSDFSIDSVIRHFSDIKHGGDSDPRLFVRSVLQERDVAVLLLIDQSLSSDSYVQNRRILDVELESVGLIGALMQTLKDSVMVAGTWSETRNHCYFRTYKEFSAPWAAFYDNASGIVPTGYTRLGPAIRYGSSLLRATSARKRLMILLTDGRPSDVDQYEGRYGIEDIHHAFLESKQMGLAVKALAIESQAKHYFPFLFGAGDYQILSNPSELPAALFRIFLETRNAI